MTSVVVGPGYTNSFRLKQFLGRERVQRLKAGEHPLASGFAAVEKSLLPRGGLSEAEKDSAFGLELFARELFAVEASWAGYESRLREHLLNASECAAIRFEMRVSTFVLRPISRGVNWTRYLLGQGDFQTQLPDLVVECKLARAERGSSKSASEIRTQILGHVRDAKQQTRPPNLPYVVAVGFDENFTTQQIDDVINAMSRSFSWFEAHPEISALLVMTPQRVIPKRTEILGVIGTAREHGGITEVRNLVATNPLPIDVHLRGVDSYIGQELFKNIEVVKQ